MQIGYEMPTGRPGKLGFKQQLPAQVTLLKGAARMQQVQQQCCAQQAGVAALRPARSHVLPWMHTLKQSHDVC